MCGSLKRDLSIWKILRCAYLAYVICVYTLKSFVTYRREQSRHYVTSSYVICHIILCHMSHHHIQERAIPLRPKSWRLSARIRHFVCVSVCLCVFLSLCVSVLVCLCLCACVSVLLPERVCFVRLLPRISRSACACVCVCVCGCMQVYVCVCTHLCVCVLMPECFCFVCARERTYPLPPPPHLPLLLSRPLPLVPTRTVDCLYYLSLLPVCTNCLYYLSLLSHSLIVCTSCLYYLSLLPVCATCLY